MPITANLPNGVASLTLTGPIQNGAPDGVLLFNTEYEVLIDALSYEGAITAAQLNGVTATQNLVSGTATSSIDAGDGSLNRSPEGSKTGNDSSDWSLSFTPTPGTIAD